MTSTCRFSRWSTMLAVAVTVSAFLVPASAFAQDAKKYRDQIAQFSKRITELRADDSEGTLNKELQQAEGWLDEALVQVGKEEFNAVKALLRRAEVQLDYVTAKVEWQKAVAKADIREKELDEAKERSRELKEELDKLRAREKGLQEQLSQSR